MHVPHVVGGVSTLPFAANGLETVRQSNLLITAAWHVQAPTKKTTYVQGAEGKALKIKIKQYGVSSSAAPSSDGRVSWE